MRKRSHKPETIAKHAYQEPAGVIDFEEEPTMEGAEFYDYLSIWYGPPKIGKSTLLHLFEDTYFLCTEPGYKFLKLRKTRIPNWQTFTEFIYEMSKHPRKVATVKLWVIDPIDKLAKFCMQWVCGRDDIAHPADQEWGKGWEAFRDEFTHWILELGRLGPGIAAISHVAERKVAYHNVEITKESPAMPKTCYTILNDLADIIGYIGFEPKEKGKRRTSRRCLDFRPQPGRDAGDRTGFLPEIIPFDTEQQAVTKILECFRSKKGASQPKKKHQKKRKRK